MARESLTWKVRRNSSIFHVLTWKAGEGTSATASAAPTLMAPDGLRGCGHQFVSQVGHLLRRRPQIRWLLPGWTTRLTRLSSLQQRKDLPHQLRLCMRSQHSADGGLDFHSARGRYWRCGGADPMARSTTSPAAAFSWATNSESFGSSMPRRNYAHSERRPVMIGGGGCTAAQSARSYGNSGADCTANGGSFGIPDSVIMDSSGDQPEDFCVLRQRRHFRRERGRGADQHGLHAVWSESTSAWAAWEGPFRTGIFTPAPSTMRTLGPLPTPASFSCAVRRRAIPSPFTTGSDSPPIRP